MKNTIQHIYHKTKQDYNRLYQCCQYGGNINDDNIIDDENYKYDFDTGTWTLKKNNIINEKLVGIIILILVFFGSIYFGKSKEEVEGKEEEKGKEGCGKIIKLIETDTNNYNYINKYGNIQYINNQKYLWYDTKLIEERKNDTLFLFGANTGHMINRAMGGGGQASQTHENLNVVPIITVNRHNLSDDKINKYHREIENIVKLFYIYGLDIVFPMMNKTESSIGKGIAGDTKWSEEGNKFANELLANLKNIKHCDKQIQSLIKNYAITKQDKMKSFNRLMDILQNDMKNKTNS
jgi:hypothetical protein